MPHCIYHHTSCIQVSLDAAKSFAKLPVTSRLTLLNGRALCNFGSYRKLRKKEHEQILINLCFALMGMYIAFILGATTAPVPVLCGISAALLQYFMLVFFSWTAVEAFYLYRKLVMILGVKEIPWLVLKIGLIVWCMFTIYHYNHAFSLLDNYSTA